VPDVPTSYALMQNHPNPFNPTTVIDYDVPGAGSNVTLRIYDVSGRLVRTLVDGFETPGRKTVTWDGVNNSGRTVATGVYFYRMAAPGFEKTRKMVMMK
jgi:flagellar hook assembly protein FlgD